MNDLKKLQSQKTELKELWDFLEIKTPFPSTDVAVWLLDFGKDQIEAAFHQLAKQQEKVTSAPKYIGKILHNAKIQNMTVEERAARISAMRAAVGAIGGRKKHEAELAKVRQEFATVCQNLPRVSQTFASGSGSGFGSVVDSASEGGTATGSEQKPAAATPPVAHPVKKEQEQNQEQNQEPKTIPPAAHASANNSKTKTAPDGTPYPERFDKWTNSRRLEWLERHDSNVIATPIKPNPSRSAAPPQAKAKLESLIGSVEELQGVELRKNSNSTTQTASRWWTTTTTRSPQMRRGSRDLGRDHCQR